MKNLFVPIFAAACATAIASAAPADDLKAAAQKLADAPNYSWTVTTEIPNSQFTPGPVTGQTEKGGYTVITRDFGGNTFQTVRKGDEVVMQNRDGDWITREEMMQQFGGGGGRPARGGRGGGMAAAATPADEIMHGAADATGLAETDGVVSGNLSAETATDMMRFGRMAPKNASGSFKVWLKDGSISKIEVHTKGTMANRDGEESEREVNRTIEIKDVGTTKVQVPDEAKKKLEAKPTAAPASEKST